MPARSKSSIHLYPLRRHKPERLSISDFFPTRATYFDPTESYTFGAMDGLDVIQLNSGNDRIAFVDLFAELFLNPAHVVPQRLETEIDRTRRQRVWRVAAI
jgi:hypothetical protein